MNTASTFIPIIEQWPSLEALGEDLGIGGAHARMLKFRDSIPLEHWDRLIEAAKRRGIHGICYDSLLHIAMARSSNVSKRSTRSRGRRKLKIDGQDVNQL